ncbi:GIY-YIG nuclease family protein [Photobacterium damselae subsp. damselae]|uniref:GIY-YIG nuclease family protein n=1 Tax=Photobacterium damselae TaxID=38293 RepID=UPI001F44AB8E|nr:GIY-YIG nuclease family protein [Photobacterium damselae]UJZ92687.1 GIY-YIG nuclease family protein [Photobacterium damselae subsp. damselae]UJZ96668.1 GIY-YIG nuclease family protein [Photobacterium damselae subsp. damselae]
MEQNILYVMELIDSGRQIEIPYKKVGITGKGNATLDSRIRQLSGTKCPVKVFCRAAWKFENAKGLEAAIHKLLDDKRMEGEWFLDPDDDLVERLGPLMDLVNAEPYLDAMQQDGATKSLLKKEVTSTEKWKNQLIDELLEHLTVSLKENRHPRGVSLYDDAKGITYQVILKKSGEHRLLIGKGFKSYPEQVLEVLGQDDSDVLREEKTDYPYRINLQVLTIAALINEIDLKINI